MIRREIPEINAGSMADIAFLLLIFFLVTTTMDTDVGLLRKLSPLLPEEHVPPEINERNIFVVLVSRSNTLFVEDNIINVKDLKKKTKEFIINPNNHKNLPEKKVKYIEGLGNVSVSKGIISLKTDRGTSYEMFITVFNELRAAVNEVKNMSSIKHFGKDYDDLNKDDKVLIDKAVPILISEAEPNRLQ